MFDQLFAQLAQYGTQLIGQALAFIFGVVWIVTSLIWTLLDRVLAYVGAQIELLTHTLSNSVFAPLIGQVSGSLSKAVNISWIIALLVLGICYMLASFGPIRVVTLSSVFSWYVVALTFFQVGPTLYLTMDSFRASVQGTFYATTLTYFQGSTVGSLNVQNTTTGVAALGLTPLCDNFGNFTGNQTGYVNGLDVALAFLRADGYDVIGHVPPFGNALCATSSPLPALSSLPRSWYDPNSFFDAAHIPGIPTSDFFTLSNDKQLQVILNGLTGLLRLGAGIILLLFGIVEQVVGLCLAIAEGLTFISFAIALLFSFFKRTEPIALAMIDQWLALVVQAVIIALLQALIVGFLVALAAGGNPIVAVGVAVVGMVIEVLVLKSALSAILRTFDGLFNALGRATGGAIGSLSNATGSVLTVATGGLSGAAMLAGGGTAMQAAGAAFGDSQALTGAMRALSRLPQGRDTDWGEGAAEFVEGAAFRGIGESIGGRVVGAPVGSYIGGRLLSTSEQQKERRETEKADSITSPRTSPTGDNANDANDANDAEVVDGELVPDVLNSPPVRDRLPAGAWISLQPRSNRPLAPRSPAGGGSLSSDPETDAYVEGEILSETQSISMRPAEGFFQPGSLPLLLGSGTVPPTESSDSATLSSDSQESEQSEQGHLFTQFADEEAEIARFAATSESDESKGEGVAEAVAHDEELTMRQGLQPGMNQADQTGLTASLQLANAATQLAGSTSALNQMSQRADVSERRTNSERQLAEVEGTLFVDGTDNVAATLANLVDSIRSNPATKVGSGELGVPDFLMIAREMADVTGQSSVDSHMPLTGEQLTPVGLFTQQALKLGLDGDTVQQVMTDVKDSPDGELRPTTRQTLTQHLVDSQGYSERSAATQLQTLENYAQAIPDTLQIYGGRTFVVERNGTISMQAAPDLAVDSGANTDLNERPDESMDSEKNNS